MIKANELRFGNYVSPRDDDRIAKVVGIQRSTIWLKHSHSTQKLDSNHGVDGLDVEPIPLAPELLEKAGFENTYNSKYKQSYDHKTNGEFGINFHSIGSMYDYQGRTFARYYSEDIRKPIRYFHEVQNLYFALTGKELEIDFL